jgi:hypothetical protein
LARIEASVSAAAEGLHNLALARAAQSAKTLLAMTKALPPTLPATLNIVLLRGANPMALVGDATIVHILAKFVRKIVVIFLCF